MKACILLPKFNALKSFDNGNAFLEKNGGDVERSNRFGTISRTWLFFGKLYVSGLWGVENSSSLK